MKHSKKRIFIKELRVSVMLVVIIIFIVTNLAFASEEFEFAKAVIRSFQCNLIGKKKSMANDNYKTDNYIINFFYQMNARRVMISWHEKAISELKPYSNSTNETIKMSAEAIITGNNVIIDVLHNDIKLLENMLNKKSEELESEMGTLLNKFSESADLADKGWELIMMGAVGVCHTLHYKQGTLSITTSERKDLLNQLRKIGVKSGVKAGQKRIDAAPSIINGFLNEKGWKTIDSTPVQ